MEFYDFKQRVTGRDEKNKPKASLGVTYYIPIKSEDEDNMYDMSIDNLITLNKPEIDLVYHTDPRGMHEFLQVNIRFISSYDPDIKEVYELLKQYERDMSEYYDDYTKCPAVTISIVPNDIYENGVCYMEMYMPMMVSLVSSRANSLPDTIQVLFDLEDCSICEDESIDTDKIQKEYFDEQLEEKRETEARQEAELEEIRNTERMAKLQRQLDELDMNDHITRVGRNINDE